MAVLIMFWWTEGPFIKCVLDLIGINVIIRIRLESGLKCEVSYRGCTHADWCHHPIVVNLSSQVSSSWLDDKNDDVFCGQCWGNFMNEIAIMHRYFKCIKYYHYQWDHSHQWCNYIYLFMNYWYSFPNITVGALKHWHTRKLPSSHSCIGSSAIIYE